MANLFYLSLPFVLLGQLAVSIAVINRIHSLGYPRWMLKTGDYIAYVITIGLPLVAIVGLVRYSAADGGRLPGWIAGYFCLCIAAVLVFIATRIFHNTSIRTTPRLVSNHTQVVNVTKQLGHRPVGQHPLTQFCARLPLNEIFQLSMHEKQLSMPRMDPRLEGLRITHLSDLHMTGQLTKSFYEELVRQVNESESDLIAITGDIIEKVACLDWIPDTLGQLRSKHGVFFVFGNHERRIADEALTRSTLTDAGLIDLGSNWHSITHNGCPIVLGGNELPWYRPAVDFATSPAEVDGTRPFRILLTHSPDQLGWARAHDCNLMLAGHTHGGQVRLPWVGAILAPSRMGTRFASGTFYYEPTLMHVSRGVAGTRPVRLNCRPEVARLVLKSEALR